MNFGGVGGPIRHREGVRLGMDNLLNSQAYPQKTRLSGALCNFSKGVRLGMHLDAALIIGKELAEGTP